MLLEGNKLSDRNYKSRKLLCSMSLDYIKIHACRNDFILYMKEYEKLNQCLKCGESCYKVNDSSDDDNDM